MPGSEHTQSLSEFREKAAATIDRLNQTGEAEILTVNGEACAVLLSPATYDEMARDAQLSRDVATIRRSRQEFKEGKSQDVRSFFSDLRSGLLDGGTTVESTHDSRH